MLTQGLCKILTEESLHKACVRYLQKACVRVLTEGLCKILKERVRRLTQGLCKILTEGLNSRSLSRKKNKDKFELFER